VSGRRWDRGRIQEWVDSQQWYQTIPVADGIVTPGTVDSRKRLERLGLPADLRGKSVLDVGCNSGMYCFECAARGADPVVGIDVNETRLEQARTLAEIMGSPVRFDSMDLLGARDLGRFDIVLCFAVVTEIPDLLGALEALSDLTGETLFLEVGVLDGKRGRFRLPLTRLGALVTRALFSQPVAQLRRTKRGWSLVPERRLLDAVFSDRFAIHDLGPSVRYRLFRLDRRP
jgi:SAM-dependent methyltransferase